mmetsp:Transcript_1956/g.5675  ORF Transcript_1956/g.5675 Transcript_1956/m.5675 type:complete len:102 (-) Transcript_1956:547-852(-)
MRRKTPLFDNWQRRRGLSSKVETGNLLLPMSRPSVAGGVSVGGTTKLNPQREMQRSAQQFTAIEITEKERRSPLRHVKLRYPCHPLVSRHLQYRAKKKQDQ